MIEKRSYRFWAGCFFISMLAFLAFNYLTWKLFTEKILSGRNYGDLARIAYRPDLKQKREDLIDLPQRHTHIGRFTGGEVDVLTIGDSFSSGAGGGKNSFYQDFIATVHGKKVVNVSLVGFDVINFTDPVQILLVMLNSGFLDEIKPKIVLLETSERLVYQRLLKKLDTSVSLPKATIMKYSSDAAAVEAMHLPKTFFVNDGNLKFYYYYFKRMLEPENSSSKLQKKLSSGYFVFDPAKRLTAEVVGQLPLSRPLFSGENGATLLFTIDELLELPPNQSETAIAINANLNMLSSMLERKNSRLYFMMIPDKINLYSQYTVDNNLPRSSIFELLEPMQKRYTFINTKKILLQELKSGNAVDLFHQDDTHWTWRASEAVMKSIDF